jgi:hypothetical protein
MRNHRGPRRARTARRAPQSDLFIIPATEGGPDLAVWQALPEAVRQSLTDLLARLLLEHGADRRRVGGRHDR